MIPFFLINAPPPSSLLLLIEFLHLLGGDGITYEAARDRTLNARAAKKFFAGTHPRLRPQDIEAAASSAGPDALTMHVRFDPQPCITAQSAP